MEGNGTANELTRDVLRAELRAGLAEQTNSLRIEMDTRFRPVNDHIARIDRGEFTPAQQAAILNVVDTRKEQVIYRRSLIAPWAAACIAALALVATVVLSLVVGGVF